MKAYIEIHVDASEERIDAFLTFLSDAPGLGTKVRYRKTYPPTPNDVLAFLHQRAATVTEIAEKFEQSEGDVMSLLGILADDKLIMDTETREQGVRRWELTF